MILQNIFCTFFLFVCLKLRKLLCTANGSARTCLGSRRVVELDIQPWEKTDCFLSSKLRDNHHWSKIIKHYYFNWQGFIRSLPDELILLKLCRVQGLVWAWVFASVIPFLGTASSSCWDMPGHWVKTGQIVQPRTQSSSEYVYRTHQASRIVG